MPGFRGIEGEGKEFRPGEGLAKEAKDIDVKVAPFLRSAPVLVEGSSSLYQSGKSEGLQGFLEIGEKGNTPDIRVGEAIRHYEFPNARGLPREGVSRGPVEMPPPEISGVRALWENISYYFKKTLDLYFSGAGGGFGGPLMIFSFLLRPKGSGEGGGASPINIKLARDFEDKVRSSFAQMNQVGYFRDSPTSPVQNTQGLYLTFDPLTSEPVLSPYYVENAIPIYAHLDHRNVMYLESHTLLQIREYLKSESLTETQHSVLWSLTRLQGTKVYLENPADTPTPQGSRGPDQILQVDPKKLELIRNYIQGENQSAPLGLMATVFMTGNPFKMAAEVPLDLMVGEMAFDPQGKIIGLELKRPAENSPRGTAYQKGNMNGTRVRVIVDSRGSLIHFEKPSEPGSPDLNAEQTAVLQEYFNSSKNLAARDKYLAAHPLVVDFMLGRGEAVDAFRSLYGNFRDTKEHFQGTLMWNSSGYYFRRDDAPARPSADQPVAQVEFFYQEGNPTQMRLKKGGGGVFKFEVLRGQLPPKIQQLLELIQKNVEKKS